MCSTCKSLTIGQLKEEIKNLPDDIPIYIDTEDDELMMCLGMRKQTLTDHDYDSDEEKEFEAFVLGIA